MQRICRDCEGSFPTTCPQRRKGDISRLLMWCPSCNWRITADDNQVEIRIKNFRWEAVEYDYGVASPCQDCELQAKCLTSGVVHA